MEIDLELYRREVVVGTAPPVRLSVIDVAPEQAQKTLVFVHGFGGQATQWRYQLEHFAPTCRVIALDLRGHGRSDKPNGEYRMATLQRDLEQALEQLQVAERFILVGHSFGGAVVTEYALTHPARIAHLVLIATPGEFKLNGLSRALFRLPLPLLQPFERWSRAWLHAPFRVLKPWHQNTLQRWQGWERFRQLAVPTLVIRGHLDFLFARPMFAEVPKVIAGAEEVDVGASGHLVQLERRAAVNRAIERVLAGATTRTWREGRVGASSAAPASALQERPWLAHYDQEVPATVAIPPVLVQDLLGAAVRRFARHLALRFHDQQWTYAQVDETSNRFAQAVQRLGLRPGERIMLLLPDLPQFVFAFYGALKAGAVVVLAPPQGEAEELAQQLNATGAQILLTTYEMSVQLSTLAATTALQHVILTPRTAPSQPEPSAKPVSIQPGLQLHHWAELLAQQPATAPAITTQPHELAVIQYTSGTTGLSKGVMLSHRNLVANTLQTRHWLPGAQEGKERFLCALSFSHIYGLTTTLNLPIALGATLLLEPGFDVARILNAIKTYQPTIFPGVPGMYVAINNFPGVRKFGIHSIKACLSGSAPLPVEVQEEFEKLTKGKLVEGYGLTEAAPVTHANPLQGRRRVGSIGIPLPSTAAKIVDLANPSQVVTPGQIGELAVRGPQVMLGYWQQPEESARVLTADGWLLTGDVAQMDEDGFFRLIARKADMWYPAKAGEGPANAAFPRDVEEVLYEVPQVQEVAVIAIANQPIAFVTTSKERPSSEALLAYCKRRLPPELVPRVVIFVDEFPRSFIGKILRKELIKRFGATLGER